MEHDLDQYWNFFLTVDNGTREGLDKFLKAASSEPETVLHYEFMQDYKVCSENPFFLLRLILVPTGNFGGWVDDIIKNH